MPSTPSLFDRLTAVTRTSPRAAPSAESVYRAKVDPEWVSVFGAVPGAVLLSLIVRALMDHFNGAGADEGIGAKIRPADMGVEYLSSPPRGAELEITIRPTKIGGALSFARVEVRSAAPPHALHTTATALLAALPAIPRPGELLGLPHAASVAELALPDHPGPPTGERHTAIRVMERAAVVPGGHGYFRHFECLEPAGGNRGIHETSHPLLGDDPKFVRFAGFEGPLTWPMLAFFADHIFSTEEWIQVGAPQLKPGSPVARFSSTATLRVTFFRLPDPSEGPWIRQQQTITVRSGKLSEFQTVWVFPAASWGGTELTRSGSVWPKSGGIPLLIGRQLLYWVDKKL
ncbi:hypothetical protein DFJ74DRAFT_672836 [Hyaloraphidium curvatum]|nr:hypothetical protein DFJ74DRAFT_672836 [Hyaloraphidium curvatum]